MKKRNRVKIEDEQKGHAVFLNLPIKDESEDAIGLSAYADSITE